MATATICFNPDHDAAAIKWDRRPNDMPFPALNYALQQLYRDDANSGQGNLAPYLYEVYDGNNLIGILVAGNFNPGGDVEDPNFSAAEADREIRAVWSDILNRDEVGREDYGPFAHYEVEV